MYIVLQIDLRTKVINVPYSWKYWRELNLAVGPNITIEKILAYLNLAVW